MRTGFLYLSLAVLTSCGGSGSDPDPSLGDPSLPLLSSDNGLTQLEHVVGVIRGAPFEQSIGYVNQLLDANDGVILTSQPEVDPNDDLINSGYDCENGGTYRSTERVDPDLPKLITGVAVACDIGGVVLDGAIERLGGRVSFTDFSIVSALGEATLIDGSVREGGEFQAFTRQTNIKSFDGMHEGSRYVVNDLAVEELLSPGDGFVQSLEAQFVIMQPLSNFGTVTVSTPTTFETSGSVPYFPTGELQLDGSDGTQLIMNADSGDDANFALTVTDADGNVVTSDLVNWDEQYRLPCIEDFAGTPSLTACIPLQ